MIVAARTGGFTAQGDWIAKIRASVREEVTTKADWASLIGAVASRKDREAYRDIFEFFAPRIKGYLERTGSSAAEAEEIAQEAMIAVWRKADKFDPATLGAAGWIFTIARNLRIDARRKGRRSDRAIRDIEAEYLPEVADSAEVNFARVEDVARVNDALNRLSAEQSEIIRLSFLEERSHSDISGFLELPLGTVKSRVRLAMSHLRKLLDDTK